MLRRIRNRQKGFTLIELLIVIAIIGIIAALLIPNFLDALQKAKQKRTVADMRNTGTAMFSWLTDQQGAAAAGATIDLSKYVASDAKAVDKLIVPQYTQVVPVVDAWNNSYDYYLDTAANTTTTVMGIRSRGRLGAADGTTYTTGSFAPTDYERDMVWVDGFFVRWPQGQAGLGAVAP